MSFGTGTGAGVGAMLALSIFGDTVDGVVLCGSGVGVGAGTMLVLSVGGGTTGFDIVSSGIGIGGSGGNGGSGSVSLGSLGDGIGDCGGTVGINSSGIGCAGTSGTTGSGSGSCGIDIGGVGTGLCGNGVVFSCCAKTVKTTKRTRGAIFFIIHSLFGYSCNKYRKMILCAIFFQ
ncbi:MAG: hypothetical protein LBC75_07820 [Fibromonadaceae bacterium]|nr:hypothetical protein [Fibromonadaceae bacterium]